MTVKTERITILGTPSFKTYLSKEAKKEGVSISELVRNRCQKPPASEEEQLLVELIAQVKTSTLRAKKSLAKGVRDAEAALKALHQP